MSKHGNIPIPNRLYMMKKNQRSTTEEEKAVFFGNQECPEIMEQITLYQDDRLAIVEDIHNLHIPEHTRSLSGSLLGYKTIP